MGSDPVADDLPSAATEQKGLTPLLQGLAPPRHGVFVRECVIGLTAFLTVVDLFATQAILPSLVRHYQVSPAAMGFAVNASTMGMAVSGPARGAVLAAHRPPARHSGQPRAAGHPDGAAGGGARPRHLHPAAHRAGRLHGLGLHADARLSRRGVQRRRRGRRVRRLHHRQRREQPDRPADLCGARRPPAAWPPTSTSSRCSISPARCSSTSPCTGPQPMKAMGPPPPSPLATWALHLRNGPAARRLRHRLLHPVRLHRHLHLRQLRADAGAACR